MLRYSKILRLYSFFITILLIVPFTRSHAQIVIPFTSGAIPLCDTSFFIANVGGIGILEAPGTPWYYSLDELSINIITDHPQTLKILLTSPAGTTLTLSAFNGAPGQNYTNCNFVYWGGNPITQGMAPFTGNWQPEGGSLSVFNGENANGVWVITVLDTSCVNGGGGPGGGWGPGWFDGAGAGSGGFSMAFNSGPSCQGWIPSNTVSLCPGETTDILGYYNSYWLGLNYTVTLGGSPISNPSTVSTPGSYWVEGYDLSGCWYYATYEVVALTGVQLGLDQVINSCDYQSIDLTGLYSLNGIFHTWYYGGAPFSTPDSATNSGSYTLIAINSGCSDTANVTLNIDPVILGADTTIEICSNSYLDLTTMYNVNGSGSAWTLMNAQITDPSAINTSGTYQLVAMNSIGCSDSALVDVVVNASPILGSDTAIEFCQGGTIDLMSLYPTIGLNSIWTTGGNIVTNLNGVGTSGTYTLVAENIAGCNDTALVHLIVWPLPAIGVAQNISICDGTTIDLTSLYLNGPNTSIWTQEGIPVPDPSNVNTSGSYVLTLTNSAGCSDSTLVVISVEKLPVLGSDQSASICAGSSYDLTSAFPVSGLTSIWTYAGMVIPNADSATVGGSYQLIALNNFGCPDTALVELVVNPNPSLGADRSFELCPWQTVDLGLIFPVAGFSDHYTLNGSTVGDPSAIYESGAYLVTITDENGCEDEATATISNIECDCEADFVHDAICIEDPVQFTLLADSNLLAAHWEFGGVSYTSEESDPLIQFEGVEEVLVILEATLSCGVVTVAENIELLDCSHLCTLWIPNAFTPDGDGINDTWHCNTECQTEEFSVQIFNRWGQEIFTSSDQMGAWDGSYNGIASPNDVYVYNVIYRLPHQQRQRTTGHVTLVR